MPGQFAGLVMVEIAHVHSGFEQSEHIVPVLVERNVKNSDGVLRLSLDASQQLDVTLDAGDQHRGLWLHETQLLQGAQAIGIAVERVAAGH
jgi:hypothetical protein